MAEDQNLGLKFSTHLKECDQNPEYDILFVEGNMDTMAKENNPQYME